MKTKIVHGVEVPLKYITPLTGKYNKGVYRCIECKTSNLDGFYRPPISQGIAESYHGVMHVWQCQNCFTKQYCHLANPQIFLDERSDYEN